MHVVPACGCVCAALQGLLTWRQRPDCACSCAACLCWRVGACVQGEAAAAINWVLKDGAGRLGRFLFARWGRELDCELKQFRLAGDLLMEAGERGVGSDLHARATAAAAAAA